MQTLDLDKRFAGSIPALYEELMVPLIFAPYADDLAARAQRLAPRRVLEIAAGTGVVTRALVAALPGATLVATDLNDAMLEEARKRLASDRVEWRQADAMALPFADASFDLVACQFGAMFFPDRAAAYAEARRVLAPGGTFLFNVWDRIEDNEIADVVTARLAELFPQDPPRFMARVPHGYHDRERIAGDLRLAGFEAPPAIATVAARSVCATPRIAAVAYCQGTPLRSEIESRRTTSLEDATSAAEDALARRFGRRDLDTKIQAHVVEVAR